MAIAARITSARSNAEKTYRHEMDDAQHAELLRVAQNLRGAVVISGYANPLYDQALAGWDRVEHAARNGANRAATEVLWSKRVAAEREAEPSSQADEI